ncbi:MAG TPA: hypothetical protein VFQ65_30460, partial [Kofleriaceae bacterium]|nr:hypothetical protein [Kofleriaceae bacterium]
MIQTFEQLIERQRGMHPIEPAMIVVGIAAVGSDGLTVEQDLEPMDVIRMAPQHDRRRVREEAGEHPAPRAIDMAQHLACDRFVDGEQRLIARQSRARRESQRFDRDDGGGMRQEPDPILPLGT